MKKDNILTELRSAKVAHLKWVQRAKALISNEDISKESIPLDYTECLFGKWFYSDAQELALRPGMDCISQIGIKHTELHEIYFKIFQIYFGEANKSFFSKLLKLKKKVLPAEQNIALEHYEQLEAVSKELLAQIEKLERRVNALEESFFNK